MSWLEQVQAGKVSKPRRVMLYGTHGVGKSSWASMSDRPIFIPTEEGGNDIAVPKFPLARTFRQVMEYISELYSGEHSFGTAVIDTVDWLERLIWAEVCGKRNVESIEDIGYGKGYQFALSQWRELLEGLDALRNDRGLTILLLAHSKVEKFDGPDNDPYDRYSPRLHKFASDVVQQWCDEVLFATYKVYTTKVEGQRAKGSGKGERIVRTTEKPSHLAKNRLCLPDELPLDWQTYHNYATAA